MSQDDKKEKIIGIIDRIAVFFFMILVFFIPLSNAVIECSFGSIFFCFILRSILRRPAFSDIRLFFSSRINLSLLVFYVCIGLSLFTTPLWVKSLTAWFCKWGEGIALFYLAQVFLKKKDVIILLKILVISGAVVCLDGFYQKITGIDFIRGFNLIKTDTFTAIRATFSYYNDFAAFLTVLFFISCGLWKQSNKILLNTSLAFLFLCIVINLLFTYSRGAWIAFIIGIIFLIIFLKNKKIRIILLFSLLIFALGIICSSTLQERFFLAFKRGGDTGRLEIWRAAILMFRESPLIGKGLGLFMDLLPKYSKIGYYYAHNCYLQILSETGLGGFLSFLWFLKEIVWQGAKKLKEHDILFSGLFFALITFLSHSFFDTNFYSLKLSILFWVLVSFIVVYPSLTLLKQNL